MFADRVAGVLSQNNPALFEKLFHKIALQLLKNDQYVQLLDRLSDQYNIVETGFCPCGQGLIVIGLDKSPWDWWSYRLRYDAELLCPRCRGHYDLQVLEAPRSTDVRAADLNVRCINDDHNYPMIVRPYYLWKLEISLKR